MSSVKNNYTDSEWELLISTPQLVGSAVASANYSGLLGTMKEAMASVQTLIEGVKMYPDNELIVAIAPDPKDRAAAQAKAKEQKEIVMAKLKANNIQKAEDFTAIAIQECGNAIALVESKESAAVVQDYKDWMMDIAQNVAEAAKEGGFLGFGGTLISEGEQYILDELTLILGGNSQVG